MYDRINWFQGWVIIVMLFTGIVMLKHYEERGEAQIDMFQGRAIAERQEIFAQLRDLNKQVGLTASQVKCANTARWGP